MLAMMEAMTKQKILLQQLLMPMEAKEVGNRLNHFCDRITKLRKSKSTRRYGSLKMDKTAGQ